MNTKPLCIYHGHCDDGFAAAWCVRKALGDEVEFYPGVYQKEPPPHEGRDVIFVDFSYKRPVLDAMFRKAKSVLILDHHKTAQEDLADIQAPFGTGWQRHLDNVYQDTCEGLDGKPYALFDMERSGAALAWDFFVGGGRPDFIEYVQDRDLWRKALPGGDEFTIALRSYPQDFATWDGLVRMREGGVSIIRPDGHPRGIHRRVLRLAQRLQARQHGEADRVQIRHLTSQQGEESMNDKQRARRNLSPHAEAIAAMYLWPNEYGDQKGGSMDFWDAQPERRKAFAREMVAKVMDASRESHSR